MASNKAGTEETRIIEEYRQRVQTDLYATVYAPYSDYDLYHHAQLNVLIGRALRQHGMLPFSHHQILDVGCGKGQQLLDFVQNGANPNNLHGIDLIPERIEHNRARHPLIHYHLGSADSIPYPDNTFDMLMQLIVFSSILDTDMKRAIAQEMTRVLKPGGIIIWYDSRHPERRKNLEGIPLDQIKALFPQLTVVQHRMTRLRFGISRRLIGASWEAVRFLERIPWLCDFHFVVLQRPH